MSVSKSASFLPLEWGQGSPHHKMLLTCDLHCTLTTYLLYSCIHLCLTYSASTSAIPDWFSSEVNAVKLWYIILTCDTYLYIYGLTGPPFTDLMLYILWHSFTLQFICVTGRPTCQGPRSAWLQKGRQARETRLCNRQAYLPGAWKRLATEG